MSPPQAMAAAPARIVEACVERANADAAARWEAVAPVLSAHLRDAARKVPGTWDRRPRVSIDADHGDRATALRAALGLPAVGPPLAPPAPRAAGSLDMESWKDLFSATARDHAVVPLVADAPPARLVPEEAARPGAMARRPARARRPCERFDEMEF